MIIGDDMKKNNSKGFTLTELLVTIALIGVVSTIAFSAIGNLQSSNQNKKYESFAKVLENAAKLYVDSNSDEINECKKIYYSDLKKYIKNQYVDKNEKCETSYVIVEKVQAYNSFKYYAYVKCGEKNWSESKALSECSN